MIYQIELNTYSDIENFYKVLSSVPQEITIRGRDEHNREWNISAKSFLCKAVLQTRLANDINWNSLYCDSPVEIYHLIKNWVKS